MKEREARVGQRVVLTDAVCAPGVIVGLRRSDGIFSSGQQRCRGSLYARVEWEDSKRKGRYAPEYPVSALTDLDAEDDLELGNI